MMDTTRISIPWDQLGEHYQQYTGYHIEIYEVLQDDDGNLTNFTQEDADQLANVTTQEKNLETKTAKQILHNAPGGFVARLVHDTDETKGEIIGCFFLRKYGNNNLAHNTDPKYTQELTYNGGEMYERSALYVDKKFRKTILIELLRQSDTGQEKTLIRDYCVASALRSNMAEKSNSHNVISITSNPFVMKKNIENGMQLFTQEMIQKIAPKLRDILIEDDLDEKFGYYYLVPSGLFESMVEVEEFFKKNDTDEVDKMQDGVGNIVDSTGQAIDQQLQTFLDQAIQDTKKQLKTRKKKGIEIKACGNITRFATKMPP